MNITVVRRASSQPLTSIPRLLLRVVFVSCTSAATSCAWDWQTFRDGPTTDVPENTGCPPVAIGPLMFSRTTYAQGDLLSATATISNPTRTALTVPVFVIAVRRPGVDDNGLSVDGGMIFDDLAPPTTDVQLMPDESRMITGGRRLDADAPTGVWRAYVTFRTAEGQWCPANNVVVTFDVQPR